TARMINNGESCIAAKRFIIHERIYSDFMNRFVAGVKALRVGDPIDPKVQVGPLATARIRNDLEKQVKATVKAGARVLAGGKRIKRVGSSYDPSILSHHAPVPPAEYKYAF